VAALYKTETHHEQIVTCHDPGLLSSPRRDWMHGRFDRRSPTTCLPGRRLRRAVFHLPLLWPGSELLQPALPSSAAPPAMPCGQPPTPAISRGPSWSLRPPKSLPSAAAASPR